MPASPRRRDAARPLLLAALLAVAGLVSACAPSSAGPRPPHPSLIPALEARAAEEGAAPEALVRLGAAYREAGRPDDARRTLERAREMAPDRADAVFFLGLAHEDLGAWEEAEELYRAFLRDQDAGDDEVREAVEARLPWVRRRALEAWARRAAEQEAELADREPSRTAVAVLPFRYRGDDPELEPLARALSGLLVTDLAQVDRLTVLERLRVDLLLDELELARSERVDPNTAARSGRLLGAGWIVGGELDGGPERLDLESAVFDVLRAGDGPDEPVRSTASLEAFVDAEKALALGIVEALGIELTPAERERVNERPTENVQALLAYGLGLEAEARGALDEAAGHFERAAELDPGFAAAEAAAERVRDLAEAASTPTASLAAVGARAYFEGGSLDDWRLRRLAYQDLEVLVPDVVTRDPAAETFRLEGVGSGAAVLDIVFESP